MSDDQHDDLPEGADLPSDDPAPEARPARNGSAWLAGLAVGVIGIVLAAGGIGIALTRDDDNGISTDDAAETTTTTTASEPDATAPTTAATAPATCSTDAPASPAAPKTYTAAPEMAIDPAKTYTATMATSCGTIVIELDAANAPVATNAFVFLAREGFYDGLTFHRVIPGFVVQGGDPAGDGSGGPGFSVPGEPGSDGYALGSIAAAKTAAEPAGTMGSQFFIVTGEQGVQLPNDYAKFGIVTEGLDVATTIASLGQADQTPSQTVYIFSVTIAES